MTLAAATACLTVHDRSEWTVATAGLASLSAYLAARDYRRIRRLREQISALARVVAPFV